MNRGRKNTQNSEPKANISSLINYLRKYNYSPQVAHFFDGVYGYSILTITFAKGG
jgi:hypothetical protein